MLARCARNIQDRARPSSSNVAYIRGTEKSANRSVCTTSRIDCRSASRRRRSDAYCRCTGIAGSRRHRKFVHCGFDRGSSGSLSLAINCKSSCVFLSAKTVRSDLSSRRLRRAISSCSRPCSSASGFGGRARFGAAPSARCFRQLLMSELYTPFARRTVERSIGELANSYSLEIRALSSAVKRRCFSRTPDSGSEEIGIPYLSLGDFPGSAGFTHHRHIGGPGTALVTDKCSRNFPRGGEVSP